MNILSVFVLSVILLKCVAAGGDTLGVAFKEAVGGRNFGWLKENWERWKDRGDLLNDVVARGTDAIVRFIQNVDRAKERALAALFDKGREGMIDDVLRGIRCKDHDLWELTNYRRELAGSPEKFFRVLDKIKDPGTQERAVRVGVENLFAAKRPDLVVPLVKALGKRTFKSKRLKSEGDQNGI